LRKKGIIVANLNKYMVDESLKVWCNNV